MNCCIKDCDKKVVAAGMCSMHYRRHRLYGNPLTVSVKQFHGGDLKARFLHYTKQSEGCWDWIGTLDANGYGRLNVNGKPTLAHRISWLLFRGPIKSTDSACHRCDNPKCVRPEHLFLGTQSDNMADKMAKKRHRFGVSLGVNHGGAKLNEDQVRFIRSAAGSSREIAEQLGGIVSDRQVRDIRCGRLWRHVK